MNKFSTPLADFKKLLTAIKGMPNKNKLLPILEDTKVMVTPGTITVMNATFKETLSATMQTGDATESFDFLINATIVNQILKSKAKTISFAVTQVVGDKDMHTEVVMHLDALQFSCDADMASRFADHIAEYNQLATSYPLPLNGEKLTNAFPFTGKDDLRPSMQHVAIQFQKSKYQIIATDAHRMYIADVPHSLPQAMPDMYLPRLLVKAMPLKNGKKYVNDCMVVSSFLHEDDKRKDANSKRLTSLTYSFDGMVIVAAWLSCADDFQYPEWRVVVPEGYSVLATVNRKQLIEATTSLLPAANRVTNQVIFHFNGQCDMRTMDADFKTSSQLSIPATNSFQTESNELDIAFDGKYLIEGLKIFTDDYVSLQMSTPTRAYVIRQGGVTMLQMPLILPETTGVEA